MKWVFLVALVGLALAVSRPPAVRPLAFDSAARAVGEVARALGGEGRGLRDPFPELSRPLLALLRHVPRSVREAVMGWGLRAVMHSAPDLAGFDLDSLFADFVGRYPKRQYPAIVLGAPGGGVAHLAALLDAPFLPVCALIGVRHAVHPDDLGAYLATARAATAHLAPDRRFEVIVHYDPLHDRDLVANACLIRIRLLALPAPYQAFIQERLAPGGVLILAEGAYSWPQTELGERIWLQIGGLGATAPEAYLVRYPPPGPAILRRESEWGCPEEFAHAVRAFADAAGIALVEIPASHPTEYSTLAYRAYLAAGARDDVLILDCFTSLDARFCKRTGIPPLHLPFGTEDALLFVQRFLAEHPVDRKLLLLHPTFAHPPGWVPLARWREALGEGTTVLVDEQHWPDDPYAQFAAAAKLARLEREWELAQPVSLSVQEFRALIGR